MNITVTIPDWIWERLDQAGTDFGSVASRMNLAISLAEENVSKNSGGPFAAVIFDMTTWAPVSAGVNLVTSENCSIFHAEMMAIMTAQKKLGCYDLSMTSPGKYELVTSTEPCAMCFGALPWSGISSLVCGARDIDARDIGFDEGPKLPDWKNELEARGIAVTCDVLRDKAASVLKSYALTGGVIYNGRSFA